MHIRVNWGMDLITRYMRCHKQEVAERGGGHDFNAPLPLAWVIPGLTYFAYSMVS